ncbi:tetratricopeptide repeat protein [bacterium]|nr:tetratricopeptide repeat protein [bacterium]
MKTKTIALLGIALIGGSTAFAQKSKVISAFNYNKSFQRDKDCSELKKGIAAIESAANESSTNTWAKTYYYGGNLYFNALTAAPEDCRASIPNALDKSMEFYTKMLKYNVEDNESIKNADLNTEAGRAMLKNVISNKQTKYEDSDWHRDVMGYKIPVMANAYINKGVEAFQNKDPKGALENFETSMYLTELNNRIDTLAIYNSALAAENSQQYDKALKYYSKLIELNHEGAKVYGYKAALYRKMGDTTSAVATIQEGRKAYPEDKALIIEELDYYLQTGKSVEALKNLDLAISKDPENSLLVFARGTIHDKMENFEKAEADYKKALELKPDYFDAAYNLGAMYFNQAAVYNNKANELNYKETTKIKEATAKAQEYFAKAKGPLKKAHEIDPSDRATMDSLMKVYINEGDNENYKIMKAKLTGK